MSLGRSFQSSCPAWASLSTQSDRILRRHPFCPPRASASIAFAIQNASKALFLVLGWAVNQTALLAFSPIEGPFRSHCSPQSKRVLLRT